MLYISKEFGISSFSESPKLYRSPIRTLSRSLYTVNSMGHTRRTALEPHRRRTIVDAMGIECSLQTVSSNAAINKFCPILNKAAVHCESLAYISSIGAASSGSNYIANWTLSVVFRSELQAALPVMIGERRWCAWLASWKDGALEKLASWIVNSMVRASIVQFVSTSSGSIFFQQQKNFLLLWTISDAS